MPPEVHRLFARTTVMFGTGEVELLDGAVIGPIVVAYYAHLTDRSRTLRCSVGLAGAENYMTDLIVHTETITNEGK